MGATDSSLGITKLTQHFNLENDKVHDRHKTHILHKIRTFPQALIKPKIKTSLATWSIKT